MHPVVREQKADMSVANIFYGSTLVRTKCKRKGQTGRGTSIMQAVTEHA